MGIVKKTQQLSAPDSLPPNAENDVELFIILSRSHTMLARSIRFFTRKKYNHTSISFDKNLGSLYSFGRRNPRNMFPAGFIEELEPTGFFDVFPQTKLLILKTVITKAQYEAVQKELAPFLANPESYIYGVKNLFCRFFGKECYRPQHYTCSAFCAKALSSVVTFDKHFSLVDPEDFRQFGFEVIFEGTMKEFRAKQLTKTQH